jgi:hypothetical protein
LGRGKKILKGETFLGGRVWEDRELLEAHKSLDKYPLTKLKLQSEKAPYS